MNELNPAIQEASVQLSTLVHFATPEVAIVGAAVSAAVVAGDFYKTHLESKRQSTELPNADPFVAQRINHNNRRTILAERAGASLAAAAILFGGAQLAGPESGSSDVRGAATVLIDSNWGENASAMKGTDGKSDSLIDSSVQAVSYLSSHTHTPTEVILDGATSPTVAFLNYGSKSTSSSSLKSLLESRLSSSTLRNGEDMAAAVETAVPFGSGQLNKIIMVAPSITGGEASAIKSEVAQADQEKDKAEVKLGAIAIGDSNADEQIGLATYDTAVSQKSFEGIVKSEVPVAASTAELEKDLVSEVNSDTTIKKTEKSDIYEDLLIADGVLAAIGLGLYRRFSGMRKLINSGKVRS